MRLPLRKHLLLPLVLLWGCNKGCMNGAQCHDMCQPRMVEGFDPKTGVCTCSKDVIPSADYRSDGFCKRCSEICGPGNMRSCTEAPAVWVKNVCECGTNPDGGTK
jgi:hypothetical protein